MFIETERRGWGGEGSRGVPGTQLQFGRMRKAWRWMGVGCRTMGRTLMPLKHTLKMVKTITLMFCTF